LRETRTVSTLPVLCKDFILEPYQIYEARHFGADAVLLISAILSTEELISLKEEAKRFDMAALVEVHDEEELYRALAAEANIIGVNNRNLKDFTVNLNVTLRLRNLIPTNIIVVSESGIKTHDDILRLEREGIDAVLIGETLVTSHDPEAKLRELKG
jgi:indole-3-glycerol phosphate synthase